MQLFILQEVQMKELFRLCSSLSFISQYGKIKPVVQNISTCFTVYLRDSLSNKSKLLCAFLLPEAPD